MLEEKALSRGDFELNEVIAVRCRDVIVLVKSCLLNTGETLCFHRFVD